MNKIILMGILAIFLAACASDKYNDFAQCLTDKDAKFYGAFWCPHCTRQKETFGSSFENVNYIECSLPDKTGQTEVCKEAKIEGYPTWEFADGSRTSRVMGMEELSQKTGCKLP